MGLATNRLADCRVKGLRASREGILEKQALDGGFRRQWQKLSVGRVSLCHSSHFALVWPPLLRETLEQLLDPNRFKPF